LGYQHQISKLEEEVANSPQQFEVKSKEHEEEIARLNEEKTALQSKTDELEQTIKTLQSKLDDVSNVAQLSELLKIQLEEKEQELDALNERLHLSEVALSMAQTQAALSKDQSENMNEFSAMLQSQQEKFLTLQDEIETIKESKAQLEDQPSVQDEELISKMKDMFDKL
jgi:chromosome segregation ATPase